MEWSFYRSSRERQEADTDDHYKNASHGEQDFREILFVTFTDSSRLVIKLADNGFTDEAHFKM